MHFTLVSLLSAAVAAIGVRAQLQVNTPASIILCEPLLVTWTPGTPPYILSVHDGSNPDGTAQIIFPPTTATSLSWTVNVSDATIGFNLQDNTGLLVQSGAVPVQSTGNTACLTGSAPSSGSSGTTTGASTGTTSTGATTPVTTSTAGTGPTSNTGATSTTGGSSASSGSTTTGSSPSTTSGTNAALSAYAGKFGITSLIGAAVALLLA